MGRFKLLFAILLACNVFLVQAESQQSASDPVSKVELTKQGKKTKKKKKKKALPVSEVRTSFIDDTQRFISSNWVGLNYNLDMFLSNRQYDRTENKSRIRFSYDVIKREGKKLDKGFDLSIKVHFPEVSKRLSLVLEKERDEILESNANYANKREATKDSDYTAGVNYLLYQTPTWKTQLDTGLRLVLPSDPFAKFKIFNNIKTWLIDISIAQKFILFRQDGFSELSQITFSRKLGKRFSMAQNNTLSWTDEKDVFILRNDLVIGHQIDYKKALAYSIGANAFLSPMLYYSKYDASISYRQMIYNEWLFGYLSVGAEFPKVKHFQDEKFVILRTEILF